MKRGKPNKKRQRRRDKKMGTIVDTLLREKKEVREKADREKQHYHNARMQFESIPKLITEFNRNSILLNPKSEIMRSPPNRLSVVPQMNYEAIGAYNDPNAPVSMAEVSYLIMEFVHTDFRRDEISQRTHFLVRLDKPEHSQMWRSAYCFDTLSFPYVDEHACMHIARELWAGIKKERCRSTERQPRKSIW